MTGAQALSLWSGRMGMRKAKGRRCACWARGGRCNWNNDLNLERARVRNRPDLARCLLPQATHTSIWGLGQAPDFNDLRVLVNQPLLETFNRDQFDRWCAQQELVCWERPELSWHKPGKTTLLVLVSRVEIGALGRYASCPGCRATDRWRARECCGVADLAGWWDAHAVAEAVMS